MIGTLWYQLNAIKKGRSRPAKAGRQGEEGGHLGAGMMGAGIAYVAAKGHRRGAAGHHAGGRRTRARPIRRACSTRR
jgi:hypothetical protein